MLASTTLYLNRRATGHRKYRFQGIKSEIKDDTEL